MCSISLWLDHLDLDCVIGLFPLHFISNALLNILVSSSFLLGEVKEIISPHSLLTNFVLQLFKIIVSNSIYFCFSLNTSKISHVCCLDVALFSTDDYCSLIKSVTVVLILCECRCVVLGACHVVMVYLSTIMYE
jgi:hypothetical protein